MNTFQRWMANATTKEKTKLARLARTTVGTLRQAAGGYKSKGRVKIGVMLALRIERAGRRIGGNFKKETLSPAWRELAKRKS